MYNHLWHLPLRTQLCRCNKRRCGSYRWFVSIPHDPSQILWQMILFFFGGLKGIAYVFFLRSILWPSFSEQRLQRPTLIWKYPAPSPSIGDFAIQESSPSPEHAGQPKHGSTRSRKWQQSFRIISQIKKLMPAKNVNIQPSISPDKSVVSNCNFELRSILTWFTDQLPTCQDL